ncbi:MAG: hypothetical protein Q8M29_16730 [Bacteroidota bacterium]|nr:hypothetical protein [Bacteroidota bacterium]
MRSKTLLLLSLFSVLLLSTECKKKLFEKITFEGTTYSRSTGLPLSGVKVTLKACGAGGGDASVSCTNNQFVIGEATSDGSGHFSITEKAAKSDNYFVWYNGNNGVNMHGVSGGELYTLSDIYVSQ